MWLPGQNQSQDDSKSFGFTRDNTKWCCRTTLSCPQNNTWEVSKGNARHHQDAPKDKLRQHQVSPQKNFTLPQVQSHVCPWTRLACPKSQSQNPMAWFVKGIGKLNPSPLGWLSHPHHHGAPKGRLTHARWICTKGHIPCPLPPTRNEYFYWQNWHVAIKRSKFI